MSHDIVESLFSVAPHLREGSKATSSYVLIRCPFHGGGLEKTPSCGVSREKPLFHCYACHEAGHISKLFRRYGATKELIDLFISQAGMSGHHQKAKAGKVGAKLVIGEDPFRGKFILDDELIDRYRVASTELLSQGFEKRTLRHFEVGVDRDNLRITFPLRNLYGELVGISGRSLIEGMEPRYKIYVSELTSRKDFYVPPDYTMDAVKEAILWHAHIIRPILFREEGDIIVTEGFKAAMWVWQAGYQNVVALIGSSLSDYHAEILATYTREVVLFLDNNEAGLKGTYYSARKLERKGLIPRMAYYPDARGQPDDLERDEVKLAIEEARSHREWRQENQNVCDEASRRFRPHQ